ncbi:MAG: BON domain-containing protein [Planctomycetaceae bacterium]
MDFRDIYSAHGGGAAVPHADIVLRLERLVQGRTGTRIRDLRVDVLEDEVVLTGRADTYYAKQLATQAMLQEIAPRSLNNAIDVV